MRKPILAANWKMHKTNTEVREFMNEMNGLSQQDEMDLVICAPYTALIPLIESIRTQNLPITVGAQNMYYEDFGAFTGEISPIMLKSMGVEYVILGHSERRSIFKEDDELISKKVKAALTHDLTPILCVGETLAEREAGKTESVVKAQIEAGFDGLTSEQAKRMVVAYEPVWAIGTGKTSSAQDANDTIAFIRSVIGSRFNEHTASAVRIQYGGSVKPENIASFMEQPDIDGALIGGASLSASSFLQLIEAAGRAGRR